LQCLDSDYTYAEPLKALFMLCHVFYCAYHLLKFWEAFTWITCRLWHLLAPEGFRRLICGPWPKKVVHHCYTAYWLC